MHVKSMFMSALGPSCPETQTQTPKAVWKDGISHPTLQTLIGEQQELNDHPRVSLFQISNTGLMPTVCVCARTCVCVFNPH